MVGLPTTETDKPERRYAARCRQQREREGRRVDVRDEVFGGRVNADLIWESVVHANAAERRGTHATKNRALVSGSGKKPWRQKGTGRARVGSIRNPLWRHGGTVFGPQPRSYDFALPKKVERGALRAALAQKLQDGALVVVDALAATEIKTKAAVEHAEAARRHRQGGARRRRARREAVAVGAQHPGRGAACRARRVTARDVIDADRVVATHGALEKLQEAAGVP